jgi:cytoskeletal protein CcmA (bactofilin family)
MALFGSKEREKPPAPPAPRSPAATPAPAFRTGAGRGGNTVIGPQIKISGELTGDEDVEISGRVEGTIHLRKNLVVSPSGNVEARIHAKNVTIAGKVKGDVTGDERVEIVASGSLEGNIRAPKIVISEGAHFRGNVDMSGKGEPPRPAAEPMKPGPLAAASSTEPK